MFGSAGSLSSMRRVAVRKSHAVEVMLAISGNDESIRRDLVEISANSLEK